MKTQKMKTQIFEKAEDENQIISCLEFGKSKRSIFHLFTILTMLLLFNCSNNMDELPSQSEIEASYVNKSSAAKTESSVELEPFESILFVPCVNSGNGEDVALTGSVKFIDQVIFNNHGFTFTYHAIPQNITGLGLSTGETFVATGVDGGTISGEYGEYGQYTSIFMVQFRLIGKSNAFTIVYKTKVTITPDGRITTTIEEENADCRL
jgi:hypothetical protein